VYGVAIGDIPRFANGFPDGGTYAGIVNVGVDVSSLFAFAMLDNVLAANNAFVGVTHEGNSNGIFDPGGPTFGGGGVPGVLGGPLGIGDSIGTGDSNGVGNSRLGGGGVPGVAVGAKAKSDNRLPPVP